MESVSFAQLVASTRGNPVRILDFDDTFTEVVTDSRAVTRGSIFWALCGENQDGHNYVADAEARGAACCVVNRGQPIECAGPLVEVEHTLQALADFAGWYRLQRDALVVGVTGSVGKTTTREMIYSTLNMGYDGIRSEKNFNNEIGLPLTLLQISRNHEFAVLELGARRTGDIRKLVEIAQPEIGVITAISPCHLETFGSMAGILQGKGELFEALPKSGFAVLAGDDEVTRTLAKRAACKVIQVGQGSHNQIRATNVEMGVNRLKFKVGGTNYEVPVTGRHYLVSALAAIAVGREIGLETEAIVRGLKAFVPVDSRCEVEQLGALTLINDTYNASPASMQAACQLLADWKTGQRRVLVAGDMLELGAEADAYHQHVGTYAAQAKIDCVIAFGPHADRIAAGAIEAGFPRHGIATCNEMDTVFAVLDCWLDTDTTVLIKGSRGMRMERVVEWVRQKSGVSPEGQRRLKAVA
ncbi:MAG: UDP-N-acetylmuramoyl-tripeptide--D-alanyl-D-alanine ligase [Planctomycetota bacterium]